MACFCHQAFKRGVNIIKVNFIADKEKIKKMDDVLKNCNTDRSKFFRMIIEISDNTDFVNSIIKEYISFK